MIGRSAFATAVRARAASGKSIIGQFTEIVRLRLGPGRLGVSEYYDFRLYEDRLSFARKREFAGYRAQQAVEDTLIDDYSKLMSLDKLTFDAVMRAHGFPVARLYAVYHPGGRRTPEGVVLSDAAALETFLREGMHYPFYAKPSYGGYGAANVRVDGYEREGDCLLMAPGAPRPVVEFARHLPDPGGLGFMFQETLRPAPDTVALCGPRVSGVRVHALLGKRGPRLCRAIWKIPAGANVVDNFQHGRSGNLLGAVDIATGKVTRVIAGVGPDQIENPGHPDTGCELAGFVIPGWQRLAQTVLAAATAFPGLLAQGWDVALTERGPVLLEVNMLGDLDLSQHACGRGFLDDDFMDFLDERGLRPLVHGPAGARVRNSRTGRIGRRRSHWPY